jgi:pseudouridine-5'-phosphate glycosidase
MKANIDLVLSNAVLAADIATARSAGMTDSHA